MPYELTDEQYQQAINLDAFTRRALANPKTRRKILEINKELNPETVIPEIDESDPLRQEIRRLNDRLDERDNNERLAAISAKWSAGQNKARRAGYTDQAINNLESCRHERGILAHEDAMAAYERPHPMPTPAQGSGPWNFSTPPANASPDLKLLYEGKGVQWLAEMIPDT